MFILKLKHKQEKNLYCEYKMMIIKSKLSGAQPEIFQGRGGFVGHFNKHFIKKSRKKAPQGKIKATL